jgi:hypothetical protein
MIAYDQGRFWIEEDGQGYTIRYDLSSLHGLIFCLFGAALFFSAGFGSAGLVRGFQYAALALGWLYGGNMVLAWTRIPRLIRRAVETA